MSHACNYRVAPGLAERIEAFARGKDRIVARELAAHIGYTDCWHGGRGWTAIGTVLRGLKYEKRTTYRAPRRHETTWIKQKEAP